MSIAHELITRGLNQDGAYVGRDGSVCLYGAARCAFAGEELDAAYRAIERAVVIVSGDDEIYAAKFNDASPPEDVLRAAKIADEILGAS